MNRRVHLIATEEDRLWEKELAYRNRFKPQPIPSGAQKRNEREKRQAHLSLLLDLVRSLPPLDLS
jgi:hypothetical protein